MNSAEQGQATIMVIGICMMVMAVLGLTVDGTRAFLYRRTLQSAADAAALAGAGELDRAGYYVSRGRAIRLEEDAARRAAVRWLKLRSVGARAAVRSSPTRVSVTLRGEVSTLFLRLVGIGRIPVAVESASSPFAVP